MKTKICMKCQKRKRISAFYAHSMMRDGVISKCKECTKVDVRKNRAENIDYYREYDRNRSNRPDRISEREKYASTPNGKRALQRAKDSWAQRNKIKRACHVLFGNWMRAQTRPDTCETCSKKVARIHAHHDDYTKPYDVRWLCPSCHSDHHKRERDEQRVSTNKGT